MTTPKSKTDAPAKNNETSRLNIILPKDFHKKIKQRALDEDITVTELIYKAVKEYLKK